MAPSITYQTASKLLRKSADDLLRPLGFESVQQLGFVRPIEQGTALINFARRHSRHREFCFSFGVGVRFPGVEALLDRADSDSLMPTAGVPIGQLIPKRHHLEWCLNGDLDARLQVNEAMRYVTEFGLPFLERYSSLRAVADALRGEDTSQWFVFTHEQRLATLVAIEFVLGERRMAVERVTSFLREHPDLPVKESLRLRQLQARLVAN